MPRNYQPDYAKEGNGLIHTKGAEIWFVPTEPAILSDTMRHYPGLMLEGVPRPVGFKKDRHQPNYKPVPSDELEKIKRSLMAKGITQKMAAARTGLTFETYRNRMRGYKPFTENQLDRLRKMEAK